MSVNLFDTNFYRAANSDLAKLGLTTDAQLLSHFQNTGLDEGRTFSPLVNLNVYRASNPDLAAAGLTTNRQLYEHLQNTGVAEGRRFSEFADINFYLAANRDVNAAFSGNREQAFGHLQAGGVAEGRRFSQFIDTNFYLAANPNVADVVGGSRVLALQHLQLTGLKENYSFAEFFDLNYYRSQNPDLVRAGLNNGQLLQHFALGGLAEGRAFSSTFDINYYKSHHPDVANAGFNNLQTYEHFQIAGLNEGRVSSSAFNIRVYLANNPDLVTAGLTNQQAYNHFILSGQREGRSGIDYAGNTLSTARNVTIGATANSWFDFVDSTNTPMSSTSTKDTDDYYRFQLTAASTVSLTLNGLSADANLQVIRDANENGVVDAGEVIATATNSDALPEFLQTNSLAAGTYYVRVYPGGTEISGATTNYNLSLQSNALPVVSNNTGMTLDEGAALTLTSNQLQVTDTESTPEQLIYTLGAEVANGTLKSNGNALSAGRTFTQADINSGRVSYQHNGSETKSDSFSFTVTDGARGSISSTSFSITVNPVNDVPVLGTNNALSVNEGAKITLTNSQLQVSDADNPAAQLTYTLGTGVKYGALLLNSTALSVGQTFTQADINLGQLLYQHNGSETTGDSFSFTVTDGASPSFSSSFNFIVVPVNDVPIVSTNTGLSINEGATASLTNKELQVTDADNTVAQLIYTIGTGARYGTLRNNGTVLSAGQSFTQADINNGQVTYQHNGDETTSDSFSFTVSDGAGGSTSSSFNFSVTPVNDVPIVSTNTGLTLAEGATVALTSSQLQMTDADSTPAQLIYTLTTTATHGTLKLNGTALGTGQTFTQADINSGLVSYQHNGSEIASDSFSFTVADGAGGSTSSGFNFTVTPVNDVPIVGTNTGLTLTEGATFILTNKELQVTDADNTAAQLIYTIGTGVKNGTLKLNGTALQAGQTFTQADVNNGLVNYQHNGSETTSDSFSFTVSDGVGGSISSTNVSITVNPANDAPVVTANTGLTLNEGATLVLTNTQLQVTDGDNTATQLTYTLGTEAKYGTLKLSGTALKAGQNFTQADINSGLLSYQHNGSETTSDSFSFTVSDGAGGSINSTNFSITVNPVNDAPVVSTNTGLSLNEGATVILTNTQLQVTDADNTPAQLTYTLGTTVTNGALKLNGTALKANQSFTQADINNGLLSYEHNGSETTSDSFSFSVSDGAGGSISSTLFNFTLVPVNDVPVVSTNTGLKLNEGATVTLTSKELQVTDGDNTATQLTYTLATAATNGTLKLNGEAVKIGQSFAQADINAGKVTYQHNGGETTSDSFSFTVSDGAGGSINSTNFSITVNPVNDAPVVGTNIGLAVNEGAIVTLTNKELQVTDADNTAAQLTYTLSTTVKAGTLTLNGTALGAGQTFTQADINNGLVSYQHNGSETTSDSFSFTASDGIASSSGNFKFTVTPVNNAPALSTNTGLTLNEGATVTLTSSQLQVTDADNTAAQLTYTLGTAVTNGILKLNGTALGAGQSFTQADINNGLLSYQHNGGETISDSFSFTVSDGTSSSSSTSFNIIVNPVNDTPVVSINTGLTLNEGDTAILTNSQLQVTDADNSTTQLTYSLGAGVKYGTLKLNGTALSAGQSFTQADINSGLVSYQHNGSETKTDSFSFTVSDGTASSSSSFNFTIAPVNDVPLVSTNTGLTLNEGATVTLNSSQLQVTDADNTTAQLTYTLATGLTNGALRLNGTALNVGQSFTQADINSGKVSYQHNGSETTSDSFSFTVSDGVGGNTSSTNFNITVNPVNDAPLVGINTGLSLNEGETAILTNSQLQVTDADNTPDQLTYTLKTTAKYGTLMLNGTALSVGQAFAQADINSGQVSYQHNGSETTSDSFSFTVSDGTASSSSSFNFTIASVNDVPVLSANTGATLNEAATVILASNQLQVTDADNTPAQVVYTLESEVANGTLKLNGTALSAGQSFAQADINSGKVTYQHNGSETTSDSFSFTVSDGVGGSISSTLFNFTINPVNDTPVVSTNTGLTLNEGETITLTNTQLQALDGDNTAAQLTYTLDTAVKNGTLKLEGTALGVGQKFTQADINSGKVTYQHNGGETASDRFSFNVSDGTSSSSSTPFNFTITAVNDAPVIGTNTGLTLNEGATAILTNSQLRTTDGDNTEVQLVYTLETEVANGTLKLNGTALSAGQTFTQADINSGQVTYQHNGGETTSDSFGFAVSDGVSSSNGSFSITVNPVNDAPVLSTNTGLTLNEGATVTLTNGELLVTDVDNTATQLTYTLNTGVTNGTLKLNDTALSAGQKFTQADINSGKVTYQHNGGETKGDSFSFAVSDGASGSISNTTFSITVNPVNDAPVLSTNTGITLKEGATVNLTNSQLQATDADNAAAQLTYTLDTEVTNGTLLLNGNALSAGQTFTQADINSGQITYQHNGSETTSDGFSFTVSDGVDGAISNRFNFTIEAVNDVPTVSTNTGLTVNEGAAITLTNKELQVTDGDNTPAQLIYTLSTPVTQGTLKLNGTALSTGQKFTQADINSGQVTYQHNGSETTSDSFSFTVSDGVGGNTSSTNFNIAIAPVNDLPIVTTNTGITLNEGATVTLASNQLQVTDADNTAAQLTYTLSTTVTQGTLKLNGTALGAGQKFTQADINSGRLSYQHNGSETTNDSFSFTVSDGNGGSINSTNFSFTINPVNDVPVLSTNTGLKLNEGATVTLTSKELQVTDADNTAAQLTYTLGTTVTNGALMLNGKALSGNQTFTQGDINNGLVSYQHNGSETKADSFSFSVSDGVGGNISTTSFSITIDPVNDAPVLSTNTSLSVNEGATVTLTSKELQVTDTDNTAVQLIYTLGTTVTNGTLKLNGNALSVGKTFTQADINSGQLSYQHNGSETTSDSFSFTVSDGTNSISTSSFNFTVVPVNDLPVLSTNTGLKVNEGASFTLSNSELQVTDVDNTPAQLIYTLGTGLTNGTLLLNGTALKVGQTFTQADINNRLVTYQHNGSETTTDSFNFTVSDGSGGNVSSTSFGITVLPVNDAPVISTNIGLKLNEGATVTLTSKELQATDVDNTAAQLTYTLGTGFTNGTLKLNGTALTTGQTFTQTDINSGKVTYQHNGSETTSDSFSFTVSDTAGGSANGNFNFTVTPVNDVPVVSTNTGLTVNEGASFILTNKELQVTDADNTEAQLTYTLGSGVKNGSLTLNGNTLAVGQKFTQADINSGKVTYQHNGGETTSDSFSFTLSDGAGGSISSTNFRITVLPTSDAPTLSTNAGLKLNEGATVTLSSSQLQVTDPDNTAAQLTYTLDTEVTNGTLKLNNTALKAGQSFTQADINSKLVSYQHNGGETTTDSFSFTVSDGTNSINNSFNFTVTPVNDAPIVSTNTGFTVNEGASFTLSSNELQLTDVDNTAAQLTYTLGTAAKSGTLKLNGNTLASGQKFTQADINNGLVSYQHNGGETTSDSFSFTASDGAGGSITSTSFSIKVNAVNDAPVIGTNTGLKLNEGATVTLTSSQLQVTDADNPPAQLTYTLETQVANGTLKLNGNALSAGQSFTQADINNRLLSYQHDGGETTTDSFSFTVSDGVDGSISSTNFNITVTAANDAPIVSTNTGFTVNEGASFTLSSSELQIADADNTEAQLTYTLSTNVKNGTLKLNGTNLGTGQKFTQADINTGKVTYQHNGGETTTDSFSFTASDGAGGSITSTSFSIKVNAVNDTPVLSANTGLKLNEGATATLASSQLQVTDADNTAAQLTYTLDSEVKNGTLKLNGTALSAGQTFTQADISSGKVTYQHNGSETTSDGFSFTVSDGADGSIGSTNFNITVTAVNDVPVLSTNTGFTVNEGASFTLSSSELQIADADNTEAQLTYTLSTNVKNGTLKLNGTNLGTGQKFTQADINAGKVTYQHNGGETTTDSFSFTASDGAGGSITSTSFSIKVLPVNDAPILSANAGLKLNEGATATLASNQLQVTDADNTAAQLTYTLDSEVTNGTLKLNGTALSAGQAFTQADISSGKVTYQHNGSETTSDGFSFTVSDGVDGSISSTNFNITVTAVNDVPVLSTNTGFTVNEGASFTLSSSELQIADVDNTEAQLTYTLGTNVKNGTLKLNGTNLAVGQKFTQADINAGKVTYQHNGGETTTDSFSFTASDGAGGSITSTSLSITVLPANDAPVLSTNTALKLNEGATATLGSSQLQATDADNTAAQLAYTLDTEVTNGTLKLNGTALSAGQAFTQADINSGKVTYQHNGSETTSDGFSFTVSDGTASTLHRFNFTINPVNDVPTVSTNTGLTLSEGATVTLTNSELQVTDGDNTEAQLVYTLKTGVKNGTLKLNGTALGVNKTFTQADVNSGKVTYQHNGGETTSDSFSFIVSDGTASTSNTNFNITVLPANDAPVLSTNTGLKLNEGATGTLSSSLLQVTDGDNTAADIVYTLETEVANGTLKLNGTALSAGQKFAQADINSGKVTYQHNGGETTSDSFSFTVSDGTDNISSSFSIVINPVNDLPTVSTNTGLTVNEGAAVTLTNSQLQVTDADNTAAQRTYTVGTTVKSGTLKLNGTALAVGQKFTQVDIDNGQVTYQHNGSETTSDSFSFTVSDGAGGSTSSSFNVTVTPTNDAPVLDNSGLPTLTAIDKNIDSASNTGTLLSAIIGNTITDIDSGAVAGIAVTGADNTNGNWEFSTNSGSSWTAFGAVSEDLARLLAVDANARIRFVPNANFFGAATIDFRAWDQTTGSNAEIVDITTIGTGGTTAFSLASETATITVNNTPNLVKDIRLGSNGSAPLHLTNINGTLYFTANDGVNGTELWKSDGTATGTTLVKDIFSGAEGASPENLTNVNGTLYFTASDGINGTELWKSDGTAAGTMLVKDIFSGSNTSDPKYLTNVNGTLYFTANNGGNGTELWKSDGTADGTVMVKDLWSGSNTSDPRYLTNVNGVLYFTANNGVNGTELWKSDGTSAGTVMVKDINTGSSSIGSSPGNFTNVNGVLYFTANNGANGIELWKSDGTSAGTVMVKDINAGLNGSVPDNFTNVNGTLYFTANNGGNGTELWKSDGTANGTVMVKDIALGTTSSFVSNITNANGTVYFTANDGANGFELWKSDGTATGTVMVKDIRLGDSSNPRDLTSVDGTLYFTADNGSNGYELWKSDGTAAGTVMVREIRSGSDASVPDNLIAVDGKLYFTADNGVNGTELWIL